jgi:uncharacterized protein YndB with AHSA1/START domain
MREVTVQTVISAPREEVFDFVSDLAGRPAWTDHYMHDYRLARINSVGEGAAARFRLRLPFAKEYAELSVAEFERPRRIVEQIAVGRRGRNRSVAVYDFTREAPAVTRVQLTTYGEPATLIDRVKEIGAAGYVRRQTKKQLNRLRMIFEDPPKEPLRRTSVAGYEAAKAPRYGVASGTDPARPSRH